MKIIESIILFFKNLFSSNETNQNTNTTTSENSNKATEVTKNTQDVKPEEDSVIEENNTREPIHKNTRFHILIDNGHGNNTSGKRSPYSACKKLPALDYYEYKWAREMADMIVSELTRLGYDAVRIVTEDNDVTLSERVKRVNSICNKYGSDNVLLVSIHSNAAGSGAEWMSARGWSAYTTRGKTKSDTLCECMYEEALKNFNGMKIRKDTTDGDSDMESDFMIIKKTKCPAVLSENFFHDNADDVRFLLSDEGKKKIMRTHVDGIIKYIEMLEN